MAHNSLTYAGGVVGLAADSPSGGDPSIPTVLQFSGQPQHVFHGPFWPMNIDLGPFAWEAWVCRLSADTGYWISEGYGGAHAILAGFGPVMTGNIWNGTGTTSFTGDYTPDVGEWMHYLVKWDGAYIYTFANGVVVSKTAFAGPRRAQQGHLFIGGSDHLNLNGRIAMVRAFEGFAPSLGGSVDGAFAPERPFASRISVNDGPKAQFLADYTKGSLLVSDESEGWRGQLSPGRVMGISEGGYPNLGGQFIIPGPKYVIDPTAPFSTTTDVRPVRALPTAPTVPAGAKIFDSFSRANITRAFDRPPYRLGQTEGGSLGPLTWQSAAPAEPQNAFGILDGRAVNLSRANYSMTWVANNSPDMDVRVDRRNVLGRNLPGIAFRVQDANNFWSVEGAFNYDGAPVTFHLHKNINSNGYAYVAGYDPGNTTWNTLRVVTSGTTITIYVDNGAGGWIQVAERLNETDLQTATGVGLKAGTGSSAFVYDNFVVY